MCDRHALVVANECHASLVHKVKGFFAQNCARHKGSLQNVEHQHGVKVEVYLRLLK